MTNFELISFANADELAARVASLWLDEIESANRAGKAHCVALSGGRITQKFFASTVEQAKARKISFERVHFFWADERCVPPTDPESNFKMANELLFAPLKIPENQIHRLRGEILPAEAVKIAETEVRQIAPDKNGQPILDLIFLGMGEDGHVASLFPGKTEGTNPKEIFCAVENSPKPPPNRISLSYAAIAAAKNVWVLISGAEKEAALRESLDISGKTPLARVIQSRQNTRIFSEIRLN
ncbi:MAG: 6-phosphogluconolactonase [Limisphaerales bacterium]